MLINTFTLANEILTVSATEARNWNWLHFPCLHVNFGSTGSHVLTLNVVGAAPSIPRMFVVFVRQNATGSCTITWPGTFIFSGAEATPGAAANSITRYIGIWNPSVVTQLFMSRVTY